MTEEEEARTVLTQMGKAGRRCSDSGLRSEVRLRLRQAASLITPARQNTASSLYLLLTTFWRSMTHQTVVLMWELFCWKNILSEYTGLSSVLLILTIVF